MPFILQADRVIKPVPQIIRMIGMLYNRLLMLVLYRRRHMKILLQIHFRYPLVDRGPWPWLRWSNFWPDGSATASFKKIDRILGAAFSGLLDLQARSAWSSCFGTVWSTKPDFPSSVGAYGCHDRGMIVGHLQARWKTPRIKYASVIPSL